MAGACGGHFGCKWLRGDDGAGLPAPPTALLHALLAPPGQPVSQSVTSTELNLYITVFFHSFIHSFLYSFIHSFIHSLTHSFIHSFIHSSTHPSTPPFIHSYIHSFIHSPIHLFTITIFIAILHASGASHQRGGRLTAPLAEGGVRRGYRAFG